MTVSIPMAVTTIGAWNGAVPAGWSLKQLKWAVTFQRGHDLPAEDRHEGSVPVVTGGGISGWHDVTQASGPGIVTGRYGTIGEFYLIDQDYWPLNTSLYSIDLHGNNVRFLRHMLEPLAPLFHLNAAKSAVPGIDRSDIHTIPVAVPPIATQRAIADFLDRELARLDGLVAAKERVLGLMAEKRRALITRAVTRGLDPRVPLRDSGIPWLGEIPAHWDVARLKYSCLLITDGTHLPPERTTTGIPLLSVRNIVGEDFKTLPDDSLIAEEDYQELCRSLVVRKDDVLLAIVGATLGKVAIVGDMPRFQIQRSLAIIRPNPSLLDSAYLASSMRSDWFQRNLWESVAFSAQPGLYLGALNDFSIICPPLSDQRAIVAHIAAETAKLDAMRSATERTIELLKERRAALIAAVVTGKIEVPDENKMAKECQNAI